MFRPSAPGRAPDAGLSYQDPGDGLRGAAGRDAADTPAVDPDLFRRTLSRHAAGVVVVTARPDAEPAGLTATSFTSVSLDPPLVSFYIGEGSTTWPRMRRAGEFAVNVLGEEQAELAARFAHSGVDRFASPTNWRPGPYRLPLLEGAAAHVICRRYDLLKLGDHWLVVGLVVDAMAGEADAPLLYHRGRFGRFHHLPRA